MIDRYLVDPVPANAVDSAVSGPYGGVMAIENEQNCDRGADQRAALIAEGRLTAEEARAWPHRNVITRAIGVSDDPELEIKGGALEPGDIFVICSDGLTVHVEDQEILALASEHRPQQACDLLVALTLERGAIDNVTVVAVRFDPAAAETMVSSRLVTIPPWGGREGGRL